MSLDDMSHVLELTRYCAVHSKNLQEQRPLVVIFQTLHKYLVFGLLYHRSFKWILAHVLKNGLPPSKAK